MNEARGADCGADKLRGFRLKQTRNDADKINTDEIKGCSAQYGLHTFLIIFHGVRMMKKKGVQTLPLVVSGWQRAKSSAFEWKCSEMLHHA